MFLNGPTPAFFVYFRLFKQTLQFTANMCEKCSSSILCWDSNLRPSEHEPRPITTRPELPPLNLNQLTASTKLEAFIIPW